MEKESGKRNFRCEAQKETTTRQMEYLEKYLETASLLATAVFFGVRQDTVRNSLRLVASKRGLARVNELLPKEKRSIRNTKSTTTSDLMKLLENQQYRCALSGVLLHPDNCSLDHILPVSLGGSDSIDNLQWVSREVNKAKGNTDNNEFVLLCKRVAAWVG
jgi:5-methylcytosine-specific restriction endonuclease McrA